MKIDGKYKRVSTTVGRALLSKALPRGMDFSTVNKVMDKKAISNAIDNCYRNNGLKDTVIFADQLMYTGYKYATKAGASFCMDDMVIPSEKSTILESAESEVKNIENQYLSGLLTKGERYNNKSKIR